MIMIKRILLPFLVVFIFSNLNAQFSQNHSLGISGTINKNIIEYYTVANGENKDIRDKDSKIYYSAGVNYRIDIGKGLFFLRSGLGINYNKINFSSVDYYVNFGIPIYIGLDISRLKVFGGLYNGFNAYKFSNIHGTDTPLNKDWCLCELNYFQPTLAIGSEFNLSKRWAMGFLFNLSPSEYQVIEGIGRIDKTQNNQIVLSFHF